MRLPKLNAKLYLLLLLLAACASLFQQRLAPPRDGAVVGVVDGDTIKVMLDGRQTVIRINGIDCPEKGQDFGSRAKQFTSDLAYGKVVKVSGRKVERYGRLVADVELPDGNLISHELLRAGLAWWFRQYAPKDWVLAGLEEEARKHGRGLWSQSRPVPPWEYRRERKNKRNCAPGEHSGKGPRCERGLLDMDFPRAAR